MTTALQHTRRVYQFDRLLLWELARSPQTMPWNRAYLRSLARERDIGELLLMLGAIWKKESKQIWPILEFTRGRDSWAEGRSRIALAPGERNAIMLLHEITHCLGFGAPHGPAFAGKYFAMLIRHLGVPEETIFRLAALAQVKFERPASDRKKWPMMRGTAPFPMWF